MIFRETFLTPFRQYADRNGQRFEVVGKTTEPNERFDAESLPMYRIRFEDGFETDAHPIEVEAPVPTLTEERKREILRRSVAHVQAQSSVLAPAQREHARRIAHAAKCAPGAADDRLRRAEVREVIRWFAMSGSEIIHEDASRWLQDHLNSRGDG